MKIFVYTHPGKKQGTSYLKEISKNDAVTTVAVFDVKGFSDMLRSELTGSVIAVLFISNAEELAAFVSIKDLLSGCPILIILYDNDKSLVSQALALNPKFVANAKQDIDAVCSVINKLIKNNTLKVFENYS